MLRVMVLALVGCGRVWFDPIAESPDALGDGATSTVRTPFMRSFLASSGGATARATGAPTGGAVVAIQFTGSFDAGGMSVTAANTYTNAAAIALDPDGTVAWVQPLHAGLHCDLRAATTMGSTSFFGGFTMGALLGDGNPCDGGVGSNQDPMILEFSAGAFTRRTTLDSSGSNGQIFQIATYSDGSQLVHGIYGGDLTINGQSLPSALTTPCEGAFTARVNGSTTWQLGMVNTACVFPGPIDLDAVTGDACIAGQFDATTNVFGTPLTPAGGLDIWIVRVAPDGTPRFVRGFGSATGDETPAGVIATGDGGCLLEAAIQGSIDLGGGVSAPYLGGGDVLVAGFDSAGNATAADTIASSGSETASGLVMSQGTSYAVVRINAPITIAGTPLNPAGSDVAVVELANTVPTRVHGTIDGAGDVSVYRASGVGGVLVSGNFTGELAAAGATVTATSTSAFVVAF